MIIILTVIAGLVFLELFIAFIVYPFKSKKNTRKHYYWIAKNSLYAYDPAIGYSVRPNLIYNSPTSPIQKAPRKIMNFDIRSDRNGFLFTEDINTVKARYKLIFCLGDSITMGSESPHNMTYPAMLDRLVMSHGYRCINAGVGGYRAYNKLLFLKHKIIPFKPSSVVLYSGWNDFIEFAYESCMPHNQYNNYSNFGLPTNRIEAILDKSALFHLTRKMLHDTTARIDRTVITDEIRMKLAEAASSGIWMDKWKEHMHRMIILCKEHSIRCYLSSCMTSAYKNAPIEAKYAAENELDMSGCFDVYAEFADSANDAMRKLCLDNGVNYIDACPSFEEYSRGEDGDVDYRKRFLLFVDRSHFTRDGNMLMARAIYNAIQKDLL